MALTNAQMQAVVNAGGSVYWPPDLSGTAITTVAGLPSDAAIAVYYASHPVSPSPPAAISGVIAANTQAVSAIAQAHATWTIVISGTWVGTIAFQASVDGGVTYPINVSAHVMGNTVNQSASSTTANGQWDGGGQAITHIRAVATAWTSGTASVTILLSQYSLFMTMLSALPSGTNKIGTVDLASLIAGEDQTNNRMMVEQRYAAIPPITTATTTVVKSGAGHLKTLRIAGGTLGAVTVYDSSVASGTLILPATTPVAGQVLLEDVDFGTGLTIVTATAMTVVGSYR